MQSANSSPVRRMEDTFFASVTSGFKRPCENRRCDEALQQEKVEALQQATLQSIRLIYSVEHPDGTIKPMSTVPNKLDGETESRRRFKCRWCGATFATLGSSSAVEHPGACPKAVVQIGSGAKRRMMDVVNELIENPCKLIQDLCKVNAQEKAEHAIQMYAEKKRKLEVLEALHESQEKYRLLQQKNVELTRQNYDLSQMVKNGAEENEQCSQRTTQSQ